MRAYEKVTYDIPIWLKKVWHLIGSFASPGCGWLWVNNRFWKGLEMCLEEFDEESLQFDMDGEDIIYVDDCW